MPKISCACGQARSLEGADIRTPHCAAWLLGVSVPLLALIGFVLVGFVLAGFVLVGFGLVGFLLVCFVLVGVVLVGFVERR